MDAHRILDVAQMREADRLTIASGTPGIELMERAGAGVAQAARAMLPEAGRVVILCGPGNNGGDGFVAARLLAEDGYAVTLALLGSREKLSGDAGEAASRYAGPALALDDVALEGAGLVIDTLFGTGLTRDLEGDVAACIARVAASGVPVLAVDIPSGIDGDTGAIRGKALPATRTVTFAARKPGHMLLPGRELCGAVSVVDIGIGDAATAGLRPYCTRSSRICGARRCRSSIPTLTNTNAAMRWCSPARCIARARRVLRPARLCGRAPAP